MNAKLWIHFRIYSKSLNSKKDETQDEENLIAFMENEIKLTENCLMTNPKSYGSWHHRFWILEHHPKPNWSKEFELCTRYLTLDDRNCKSFCLIASYFLLSKNVLFAIIHISTRSVFSSSLLGLPQINPQQNRDDFRRRAQVLHGANQRKLLQLLLLAL